MMMRPRITLLASQEAELKEYLESHPLGHERGAIVLFRRHACTDLGLEGDRYIAVEVIPFQEHWVTSSSTMHVAFELKHFREIFRRCEEESLVFGFVHAHPAGPIAFSDIDDSNEETLVTALRNRNGSEIHFVALLWAKNTWLARMRNGLTPGRFESVRHVAVVGQFLDVHLAATGSASGGVFDRQEAAFGRPFVAKLQSLRVAVIGAGGTGSSLITLLARAGVGELILIDGDALEASNLNRIRGVSIHDVGKNKASLLKSYINHLGLPTKVWAVGAKVDMDARAIDAIATCDVIFGCTDDQIGREVLNAALYIYALAYIDMGLGGQVHEDKNGQPYLRYHHGRLSTILPEAGECLFCQGIIKDVWIRHEYARRLEPNLSAEDARERYLEGGGEQAPGVGPFTSAVADFAASTLFDLIKPFRKFPPEIRRDYFTIDFVRMEFSSRQARDDANCVYCQRKTYLLKQEEYRLGRPALGKRNRYV